MRENRQILAWVGWEIRVPEDWRPLRIEGEWSKGSMIVGSAEEAAMQVRWWRPGERGFDPETWLRKRMTSLPGVGIERTTRPGGFTTAGFVPDYTPGDGTSGVLWFGYSPTARMVVEIVAGGETSAKTLKTVSGMVIPSLEARPEGSPTRWAVFGASFESPSGFFMTNKKLLLGDVAVELSSGNGCRLLLRQVYPSKLALARRKLTDWLEFQPFKEHRCFRPSGPEESWNIESSGRQLAGLRRTGRKAYPFPLGVIAPRKSTAAVVHDEELDRLLIAECDSKKKVSEPILSDAIAAMNWAYSATGERR
jgi:hypothetical protein